MPMTTAQLIARDHAMQAEYFGEWVGWGIVVAVVIIVIFKAFKDKTRG